MDTKSKIDHEYALFLDAMGEVQPEPTKKEEPTPNEEVVFLGYDEEGLATFDNVYL